MSRLPHPGASRLLPLAALAIALAGPGCPAGAGSGGAVVPVEPVPVEPVPVEPVPVEPVPVEPVPVEPVPVEPVPVEPPEPAAPEPGFLGGDDDVLLEVICTAEPVSWERNRGGTTLSFRLEFEDGTRAAYKPAQSMAHSHWEAEVATYRLARHLGIHSVPPSCERSATRDDLLGAEGVGSDTRARIRDEVTFAEDGTVRGMAMYWVPDLRDLEEFELGGDWMWWIAKGGHIPQEREQDAADLSDMLLLDWLVLNVDRWTGGQIRRQGANDGPIVLIDHAAGFGTNPDANTGRVWPPFRRVQRFRRSVVERLREIDDEVMDELFSDVLDEEQRGAFVERLDRALERIDELIEQFGEDSVLYFD